MTATLTADELAQMQATQEENLPDVCNVVTISYTKNARGVETEVPVVGAPFACRVRPAGGGRNDAERLILDRLGVVVGWKIKAPKAVTLAVKDKIQVSVDGEAVRVLEVVAAPGLKSRQTIDTYLAAEFG